MPIKLNDINHRLPITRNVVDEIIFLHSVQNVGSRDVIYNSTNSAVKINHSKHRRTVVDIVVFVTLSFDGLFSVASPSRKKRRTLKYLYLVVDGRYNDFLVFFSTTRSAYTNRYDMNNRCVSKYRSNLLQLDTHSVCLWLINSQENTMSARNLLFSVFSEV